MFISITIEAAKNLYKSTDIFKGAEWQVKRDLVEAPSERDKVNTIKVDLTKLKSTQIKKFRVQISGEISKGNLERIDRWIDVLDSPDATEIPSVKGFKEAIISYLKKQSVQWLWTQNSDGFMLPWLVDRVTYNSASRYDPEHITIRLVKGVHDKTGSDATETTSESFYYRHMYEVNKEDEDESTLSSSTYFLSDSLEDETDDDMEDQPKKTTKKNPKKRKSRKLAEILASKGLFFHNDGLQAKYVDNDKKYIELRENHVGKQFTTNGLGFWKESDKWYSNNKAISLIEDGRNCKLVVDYPIRTDGDNERSITYSTTDFGMNYLPYHPYMKLYDITKHRDVSVHVEGLIPYRYNKSMLDNLILPESVKTLVNALVDGEAEMEGKDIVEGKSGGIIILCAGSPGTGKSLTGEVYSEYVEKPLYQIQSSQLGISVDDIEKNLAATLRRAERWNCILMIDEADTYVYERGQDITQNCIIGTFLRLLEYYNGIMFLTTNRAEIVDDAIMSRVTVKIDYENPDQESLGKIWKVLSKSFSLNLPEKNIEGLVETYPDMSGRDVRNFLKLLKKYYRKNEEIDSDSIKFIQSFIPSLNKAIK